MNTADTMLDRFNSDGAHTASGPRIVVMCFDRLDRDLAQAIAAIEQGDHFEANETLGHAQDLLGEVAAMLDLESWEHAGSLVSVYDYVLRRLATANIIKDVTLVAEAQRLVTEIGDAFRVAAEPVPVAAADASSDSAGGTPAAAPTAVRPGDLAVIAPAADPGAVPTSDRPRLSIQA